METTVFFAHDGHDIEIRVEFDAYFQRGYTSGPAEHCYPDESNLDITDTEIVSKDGCTLSDKELLDIAADEHLDRLEQACWDEYFSECRNLRGD